MRNKTAAGFALLAITLTACTPGTQGYLRNMEGYGNIRVDPSPVPGYDYVVTIRNVLDLGYDPSKKDVRDRTALQMLATQCPQGKVVGETVINTGEWLGGRPAMSYAVQVQCAPTSMPAPIKP